MSEHVSTNLTFALAYAQAGIAVFPCSDDKKPLGKWRTISTTNPATIRFWWKSWKNAIIGIDLAKSGLVVVDADRHDPAKDGVAALARLESENDVLPNHPIVYTRGSGQHHYFKQPHDSLGNGRGCLPDGIDIRGSGGYVIAGGSTGWEADPDAPDLIESYKAKTVPELPAWLVNIIKAPKVAPQAAPEPRREAPPPGGTRGGTRERAFAEAALDGNCNELEGLGEGERNNRLNAIAYRLGRMVARGWLSEFEVIQALEEACQSNGLLQSDGAKQVRATIKSGLAKGRLKPHEDLKTDEVPPRTIIKDKDGTRYDAETGEVIPDEPLPKEKSNDLEALTYCDGLIGELVDWIVSTARRPNRILALGAAISVIGTLIGRRVAGPTKSGTHLYVLGLGGTGVGKGTPLDCAKDLLFAAGASHLIGPGRFTTGPAISGHIENNPLSLCCQDEFGSFIGRVNKHNASSWEAEVSIMYRELWSLSFKRYDGMQWANRDRKVIHAPAFSIVGMSTPGQFFDSLKSGDLTNGFINRFLVLPSAKKVKKNRRPADSKVPEQIVNSLVQLYPWRGASSFDVSDSNRNHIPVPDVRPWASRAAEAAFEAFEDHMDDRIESNEYLENFLERTAEMAARLATIRAAGRNIGNYDFTVDLSDIQWGIALAEAAGNLLVEHAGNMLGDREVNRIREIIEQRKKHGIKHSELLKKSGIKSKALADIIRTLEESEDIITEKVQPPGGKGRTATEYRIRV